MTTDLTQPASRLRLAATYRTTLLEDVIPFWLRHGLDHQYGGMLTVLDRDGSLLDSDKSIWFQGRTGWMMATLHNTVEARPEWLEAARSCVEFLRRHGHSPQGKMWFSVTRDGRPLRLRRYVFSESFAAIASAAYARASGDARAADEAAVAFAAYLRVSFEPGAMLPKYEPTRPMKGLAALMIAVATAQELRANLGEVNVAGRTCSEWIDTCLAEIERDFLNPAHRALMETVAPDGSLLDHVDGRLLNPGHALECSWFILNEAAWRGGDRRLIDLGTRILDWMWARGWDTEFGGLYYFRDLHHKPVLEYWHDMKFWWPHCEAIIATLFAWKLTGEPRYAAMHAQVHDWSFQHFPDPEYGEWFGYLHRDGRLSQPAKGSLYKGPFHLPRMLWQGARLLDDTFGHRVPPPLPPASSPA